MACAYCSNHLNSELQENNDYGSISVGRIRKYMRLSIESGGLHIRPRFVVEEFNGQTCEMNVIGYYCPKYCPECGEKVVEIE